MESSGLEESVIHAHGDVMSIFPVSKQTKLNLFLTNYRTFASIRPQKHSSDCLAISLTLAGYAVALKASMHPFRYD